MKKKKKKFNRRAKQQNSQRNKDSIDEKGSISLEIKLTKKKTFSSIRNNIVFYTKLR